MVLIDAIEGGAGGGGGGGLLDDETDPELQPQIGNAAKSASVIANLELFETLEFSRQCASLGCIVIFPPMAGYLDTENLALVQAIVNAELWRRGSLLFSCREAEG